MSGPKRSSWSLSDSIGRMVSRHIAEQAHRAKVSQLENAIEDCRDQLEDLEAEYGEYAAYVVQRASVWLAQAESTLRGDLRYGWRQVNGARSYIANQASRLAERRAQFEQRQQYRQEQARRRQEQARRREEAMRQQQEARRRYDEERRKREQARQRQADDLAGQISDLREELTNLQHEYGAFAAPIASRVGEWLNEAQESLSAGNLGEARRSLSGSRQYLDRQIETMARKQTRARQEQERLAPTSVKSPVPMPEEVHEPTEAERMYDGLKLLLAENPEIANDGIEQNVQLIGMSLEAAPDNPNTLAQVNRLFDRVQELVEEAERKRKEHEYARSVFASLLGSGDDGDGGSGGGGGMAGMIDGMPVSVQFEEGSNNFVMNTPEDGGCKQHLEAFAKKLADRGVSLGPVRIGKTGENWHAMKTSAYATAKRHNA